MQPESESTKPITVIVSVASAVGAVLGALANGILFLTRLQAKLPPGIGYLLSGVSIGVGVGGLSVILGLYLFSRERRPSRDMLGWTSGIMGFFTALGLLFLIIQTATSSSTEGVFLIHSDGGTYTEAPVTVSDIRAFSQHDPPHINDTITVQFVFKNQTAQAIRFRSTHIAARNPERGHKDFGEENYGLVLEPDQTIMIRSSTILDEKGTWDFWPGYRMGETQYGPPEWRVFEVRVTD